MQQAGQKKGWTLTSSAFARLLDWLDEGTPSDGQKYLEMRRRLVVYFDRKNCPAPDELADETLNRVAHRLEAEGAIQTDAPARYCYIVARFIFMEYLRGAQRGARALEDVRRLPHAAADEHELKERRLRCLEQCTAQLEPPNRELITRYYLGKERGKIENRRALAAELGITVNALSVRACRIRDKLEACVRECVGA